MKRLFKYLIALTAMMVVPMLLYFGLKVFIAPPSDGQQTVSQTQKQSERQPEVSSSNTIPLSIINSSGKHIEIQVEKVSTPTARMYGLMFRTSLPEYNGMLFVYEKDQPQAFWMKNTLIPLDAIFINSKKEIVSIKTMTPCKTPTCPSYPSDAPAQYVLEVNGGFAEKNNVSITNRVEF